MEKQKIRFLAKKAIQALFGILQRRVINPIQNEEVRDGLTFLLYPFEKAVIALTDSDPDNETQLKEIWESHKEALQDYSIDVAISIIEKKVKDEEIRDLILSLLAEETEK